MPKDFLDEIVKDRTANNPEFPNMVADKMKNSNKTKPKIPYCDRCVMDYDRFPHSRKCLVGKAEDRLIQAAEEFEVGYSTNNSTFRLMKAVRALQKLIGIEKK
jgi:hypothetical protein